MEEGLRRKIRPPFPPSHSPADRGAKKKKIGEKKNKVEAEVYQETIQPFTVSQRPTQILVSTYAKSSTIPCP
jgi:hypothetical protein